MIFGFKNKKSDDFHSLTEDDIRSRLYGAKTEVREEAKGEPAQKKKKPDNENRTASYDKELKEERAKIWQEIQQLKKELQHTKRRLEKMRGLKAKKLRLLAAAVLVFLIMAIVSALAIRQLFMRRPPPLRAMPAMVSADVAKYCIQAAVYGSAPDAQKFMQDLNQKGYATFMHKSYYRSGKEKFTIYVGGFKNREDAIRALDRLKQKEGIGDGFITDIPK